MVVLLLKILIASFFLFLLISSFCVFFDQAVLVRRGTIYRIKTKEKKIALTFDDGPSNEWTPQILDALKESDIKATFFMVGYHVKKYPQVARRVAQEGHLIGNHGYAHSVVFYYKPAEIEEEIKYTEAVIREVTGQVTKYFRPPKAWLSPRIKSVIRQMGYEVVLWSLNSKDWVMFNHRKIVRYLVNRVRDGDIILFHDSGNIFSMEGSVRRQTVKAIPLLAAELKKRGYQFVLLDELLRSQG